MVPDSAVVLLGEDIEDDAILFQLVLKRAGVSARVMVMEEASEIVHYLSGQGKFGERNTFPLPNMIFLDGQLHHEPSMGLLRWMVEQPGMKETPIIILTGSLDPKVCEEAKNIGAFECFEKPFTEADIRKLECMLEERRLERLA